MPTVGIMLDIIDRMDPVISGRTTIAMPKIRADTTTIIAKFPGPQDSITAGDRNLFDLMPCEPRQIVTSCLVDGVWIRFPHSCKCQHRESARGPRVCLTCRKDSTEDSAKMNHGCQKPGRIEGINNQAMAPLPTKHPSSRTTFH